VLTEPHQRRRGNRDARSERRLITASPKFHHSSLGHLGHIRAFAWHSAVLAFHVSYPVGESHVRPILFNERQAFLSQHREKCLRPSLRYISEDQPDQVLMFVITKSQIECMVIVKWIGHESEGLLHSGLGVGDRRQGKWYSPGPAELPELLSVLPEWLPNEPNARRAFSQKAATSRKRSNGRTGTSQLLSITI
jgi:hypothetical protein